MNALTCAGALNPDLARHRSSSVLLLSFLLLLSAPVGPSSSPPRPHPPLPLPALVRVYFSGSNSGARCDGGMLSSTLAEGHIFTRWQCFFTTGGR